MHGHFYIIVQNNRGPSPWFISADWGGLIISLIRLNRSNTQSDWPVDADLTSYEPIRKLLSCVILILLFVENFHTPTFQNLIDNDVL